MAAKTTACVVVVRMLLGAPAAVLYASGVEGGKHLGVRCVRDIRLLVVLVQIHIVLVHGHAGYRRCGAVGGGHGNVE